MNEKVVVGSTEEEDNEQINKELLPFIVEWKVKEKNAIYQKGSKWESVVRVCDRLVSGQNDNSAKDVAEAMVTLLERQL